MTTWIGTPEGGRDRGLRGILRAWIKVLVRPRRFFQRGITPADQAPALFFAMAVTATALGGLALSIPGAVPPVAGSRLLGAVAVTAGVVLLVTPVALHLTAAVGTITLIALAPERAGVSETVQVVGYASAPLALVGIPVTVGASVGTALTLALAYGAGLLAVGIATRHRTGPVRAILAAAPPVAFVSLVVTAIRIGNSVVFGV